MKNSNIVIGIEGTVGAGKTSICRKLLDKIENSIIIHGGNIYRAIVYAMIKSGEEYSNDKKIDVFELMNQFEIEVKLKNRETVICRKGIELKEDELQTKEVSIAVSQISNIGDNEKLYQFGRDLIDQFRKKYNVILSSRDIVKMYPDVTYHFFIDASLEERIIRKYEQYHKEIDKEEIKKMIEKRDELQEKSGYYKIYSKTKIIDVTDCKTVEEAVGEVFYNIK